MNSFIYFASLIPYSVKMVDLISFYMFIIDSTVRLSTPNFFQLSLNSDSPKNLNSKIYLSIFKSLLLIYFKYSAFKVLVYPFSSSFIFFLNLYIPFIISVIIIPVSTYKTLLLNFLSSISFPRES